jgi:hypothetical protein
MIYDSSTELARNNLQKIKILQNRKGKFNKKIKNKRKYSV